MCRMLTKAHDGKEKGTGYLSQQEFESFLDDPRSRNLVLMPRQWPKENLQILIDRWGLSQTGHSKISSELRQHLYIPVSKWLDGQDRKRLEAAAELEKFFGLSLVATNEVCY